MPTQPVNIAIGGLGFGAEFIPIYQRHPEANLVAICQRTESTLNEVGDKYGITKRYQSYDDLLAHESAQQGGAIVRLPEFNLRQ